MPNVAAGSPVPAGRPRTSKKEKYHDSGVISTSSVDTSPISISNLQSPISNLDSGGRGRGGARTFKEMRYGFIHTAHLRSPISNLPFDPCRRQLRSPISNLDLQSPPQRWMPGARIYDLCSPSPISTFDPGNCQHDPQSVISIFHLQPSPTVW